jgi:hypothetical protein
MAQALAAMAPRQDDPNAIQKYQSLDQLKKAADRYNVVQGLVLSGASVDTVEPILRSLGWSEDQVEAWLYRLNEIEERGAADQTTSVQIKRATSTLQQRQPKAPASQPSVAPAASVEDIVNAMRD